MEFVAVVLVIFDARRAIFFGTSQTIIALDTSLKQTNIHCFVLWPAVQVRLFNFKLSIPQILLVSTSKVTDLCDECPRNFDVYCLRFSFWDINELLRPFGFFHRLLVLVNMWFYLRTAGTHSYYYISYLMYTINNVIVIQNHSLSHFHDLNYS
jgi:hypothetical protein